ncbi:MAG: putative DNA methylase [uncultured bacterium]|nr:MAG: putative DNA methylase [uncultured bacterium]
MKLAILGNTPELSALELGVEWEGGQIAVLKHEVDFNILGGTVKIAEVIDRPLDDVLEILKTIAPDHKIVFGFSVYTGDNSITAAKVKEHAKALFDYGMRWKKQLKAAGRSVRFVVSQEPALSSVIVQKEHLLRDHTDFVIALYHDKTIIARTSTVQDFKDFSQRDFGRPQRDAFSGMLPPKVARMMVNIAAADKHALSLLDPFCGSGTVIQEALSMGFTDVIGSDISQKCIDDTETNLAWENLPIPPLFCSDVLQLQHQLPDHSIDIIVTEGYLGPVQPKRTDAIYNELTSFYEAVFPVLARLLKPHGRIVIALPSWNLDNGLLELPLDTIIAQAGFKSFHQPINYSRQIAKVVRKIFFLYN